MRRYRSSIAKMNPLRAWLIAFALCAGACADNRQSASETRMAVYKYTGKLQCEQNGIALDAMRRELSAQGVKVLAAQTSRDGRAYATVCGGQSGEIHVFEIPQADSERAAAGGFKPMTELGVPRAK